MPLTLFELRNYVTQPGLRDRLIDLFERHLLDVYESAGARILGSFINLDEPDRWVWIRAFADNATRESALRGFYGSAVWKQWAKATNATIEDVGDAVLLRDCNGNAAFGGTPTPPGQVVAARRALIACSRYWPRANATVQALSIVQQQLIPALVDLGGTSLAVLETASVPNVWRRLPLREEPVLVTLTRFASLEHHAEHVARRDASPAWSAALAQLTPHLSNPIEHWRLQPSARSTLW